MCPVVEVDEIQLEIHGAPMKDLLSVADNPRLQAPGFDHDVGLEARSALADRLPSSSHLNEGLWYAQNRAFCVWHRRDRRSAVVCEATKRILIGLESTTLVFPSHSPA